MSRWIAVACMALLYCVPTPQNAKFSKYKAVDAYEVRPAIIMMPRYSRDGNVCEIGLEKRHYSADKIILDSSLPRNEINEIVNELVPANERGPKSNNFADDLILQNDHSLTTTVEYENISVQIVSEELASSKKGNIIHNDIVAIIRWKKRQCQQK